MNRLKAAVGRSCEVCKPHNHLNLRVKGTISYRPVCPEVGVCICINVFMMPDINRRGEHYNYMMMCEDRFSEWMLGTPHGRKGLNAEGAPRTMVD